MSDFENNNLIPEQPEEGTTPTPERAIPVAEPVPLAEPVPVAQTETVEEPAATEETASAEETAPAEEIPARTEGYEGFYHLTDMKSDVEKAEMSYILRDPNNTKIKIKMK